MFFVFDMGLVEGKIKLNVCEGCWGVSGWGRGWGIINFFVTNPGSGCGGGGGVIKSLVTQIKMYPTPTLDNK